MASSNAGLGKKEESSQFRLQKTEPLPKKESITWQFQLLVFALGVFVVFLRRPDALLNPQFFGEDGPIWFHNAYTFGWARSLLHSENGYFQTLPRLAAAMALLVPLQHAPLVMNLIGITVQVLPVNLLLSPVTSAWAPLPVRALMAVVYLALPNTRELDASVEEGQWHLALLACMIVLARLKDVGTVWKILGLFIVALSGVTGVFCVLLFPLALVFWWFRRTPFRLAVAGVLAMSAMIQLAAISQTSLATRPNVSLGATPRLFVELLGGHIYMAALLGQTSFRAHSFVATCLAVIVGTAVLLRCLSKASLELRLFVLFSFLVFALSLKSPMVSMTEPQWHVLNESPGIRYWFFPTLAFAWSLAWCATEEASDWVRLAGLCGLLVMLIGIARDWKYPAYDDVHFPENARRFEAAPPGSVMDLPIYPPGWIVRLTKKSASCTAMPIGGIDAPAANSRVSGSTAVSGWAIGSQRISSLVVYIDGNSSQSFKLSSARPDIDNLYPDSPDKNKGWATQLDLTGATPGRHEIKIRARSESGCEADLGVVPVDIVR